MTSFFDEVNLLAGNIDNPREWLFSDSKRVISGKHANDLCAKYGIRIIKLLNHNMKHHGLLYQENSTTTDPNRFQSNYVMAPGGLYCCSDVELYIHCWKRKWVASVTFPDDALVYFEEFRHPHRPTVMKSTALTLGPRMLVKDHPIWQKLEFVQTAVELMSEDVVFYQQLSETEKAIINYSTGCIDIMKNFHINIPFHPNESIRNLVLDYESQQNTNEPRSLIIDSLVNPDNETRTIVLLIACICDGVASFYTKKNRSRLLPDNSPEFQKRYPHYDLLMKWAIHSWKTWRVAIPAHVVIELKFLSEQ